MYNARARGRLDAFAPLGTSSFAPSMCVYCTSKLCPSLPADGHPLSLGWGTLGKKPTQTKAVDAGSWGAGYPQCGLGVGVGSR